MDRADVTGPPESFIGRWSRRKHHSVGERESVAPTTEPEGAAIDAPAEEPPSLTDSDMPPVESLGDDDDYSGFLSAGVSDGLRRSALRRLFHSDKFNAIDGLDDYAEDFASFAPLGDIVTADMKHHLKRLFDDINQEEGQHTASEQVVAAGTADDGEPEPLADEAEEDPHS